MAKQKIAVITGAGSGIGLALCRELLISDPKIFVVAFCRKRPALDALQKKFRARLIVECVEFNHNAAMDNIRRALERYEHIDYLVHCAGIVTPLERIPTIDHKDWRKTQRVNSDIPFFMTQLCLKKFAHSRVLFLTSDQPVIPVAGAAAYSVSKAALNLLCGCFRQEIDSDIAVFATVAPGNVDTPMQEKIRQAASDVLPFSSYLRDMHAQKKLLPPHLVAKYLWQLLMHIDAKTFGTTEWNLLRSVPAAPNALVSHDSVASVKHENTDLQYMQSAMEGSVWGFGSKEYELRRKVFNRGVSHFPIAVVVPNSEADIIKTIEYANQQRLQISIKGAGHGVTGTAVVRGGIVIDMSSFQSMELSSDGLSVCVGAGVKNRDLDLFLSQHDKVVPLGTCPDVGVVGATLGGGIGFLSRKHGLSCDNVIAFSLIMADGQHKVVTPTQHTELFWALRGSGGGQFGVITQVTFALHPAPTFVEGGIIEWPFKHAKGILQHYSEAVLKGPKTQFLYAYIAFSTSHIAKISIMGFSEEQQFSLRDITNWAVDSDISVTRKQYVECQSNEYVDGLAVYWRNGIIEGELTEEFVDVLIQCFQSCPDNSGGIMLDPLCGAIQDIGTHETAFIHRDASFVCSITGVTPPDQDNTEVTEWVNQTYEQLCPFFNGHAYQNYDMGEDCPLHRYFGQHTERLLALKQQFDPELRFTGSLQRHLQNYKANL